MHITRNSLDTARGPADWFTGEVHIDTVEVMRVVHSRQEDPPEQRA